MKIEVRGREICQSNNCIGLQADNNVEIRDFVLSRYYGDIDLSEGIAYLLFCDPSGRTGYIPLEKTVAEDSLSLRWIVGSELTAAPGQIKAQIKISGLDAALWHSEVAYFHVAESIPAESPQPVVFSTRAAIPRTSSPETEPPITISERKINIPAVLQNIAVQNDENSETVTIQMPRFFDGHDLSEHIIILKTVSSGGRDDIVFSDVAVGDSELTFQWTLRPPQTSYNGTLTLQLRVEGQDFKWETDTATVNILRSIDAQPVIPSTPSILDGFAARLETAEQNAQSALDGLAGKVDKVMGARLMTNEEAEKLSGLHNYILPTAGDELGGVKNGGSVVVKADGTMDAPTGGSKDGTIKASDLICASCDTGTWVSYPSGGGPSLGHESYVLKFTYYESDRGYPSLLPIRFEAPTDGNSDLRFEIQGKVIYINGSSSNIASDDLIIPTLENGDAVPDGYINEGCIVIVTLDLQTLAVKIVDTGIVPVGTVGMINNRLPDKNGVVILSTDDVGAAAADHTHTAATTSAAGFISAEDKTKLDGIAAGANNYTHPATHPSSMITGLGGAAAKEVGTTTGTVAAGDHTHTPASIGAAASSHTHTAATTSTAGFLSASDKTKLNGIATGANNYVLPVAGTALGGVKNGGNVTINSDGTMTAPEGGGSGGAVESVNGKTGAVTLTAADVGALPEDVTSITTWKYIWDQGLYRSVGDVTDAPDQSGLLDNTDPCYGLVIGDGTNNVEVVFRRNADKEPSVWHRYYMGSGYYSDWYKIAPAEAGADITVTQVDDWNNVTATGFYKSYASTPNAPYQSDDDNSAVCGWAIALNSGTQQFAYRNTQGGGPIANALYTRVINPDQRPAYYGDWELVNKQTAADVPVTAISGMTATNVQEALEENFQSVVDGKSSLETAITDKGGTVSKAGDVATFAELATGVGTISGGGSSENYVNMLKRDSTSVVIPLEAESIGDHVFYNWKTLESISGWDNITEIGDYAFYGCEGLTVDALPNNLATLGISAFQRCKALALTALPASLVNIGNYAFEVCTALALTSLPAGLTKISQSAFASCSNLALTALPEGVNEIGSRAFQYCSKLALTALPAGITQIKTYTFQNCTSLKITSLPDALTTIESMAFAGCTGLTSITIGANVTSIVTTAFSGCTNLTQINCQFAQGAVSGAPWGATNANIVYVLV